MVFRWVCLAASLVLAGASPALAQDATPSAAPSVPKPVKHAAHKPKVAKATKPASQKPAAPEPPPWAAVDPGRVAGGAVPPDATAAAMPGIRRTVQPDQDALSYGVQWNSSNASNAGHYSTQGVVNEINHDLGAPNSIGTDAEVGMKLHF